ncbi:MAG: pyrroline-5-carboxylate reductase [Candidatus Thioglobus sp.]|nr:pyrroline-5-carboxylate reductase [Candidatus Thioglobus pontius]MBL6976741.1 pyrroline-5-carboxylate reductase [Candidatus Thioglobus sp.]MBL6984383.1 pyrroline-5-carboxylate reductase [Candidatus Thioglobus sp.]
MQNSTSIGFIGAGNMACAIISGLINQGISADKIKISDTDEALLSLRKREFNLEVFTDNSELADKVDIVVLAVKPQVLSTVCRQLQSTLKNDTLVISIAAGIRTHDIERWLGGNKAIVRTMPNTPALLNQGVTGLFANEFVNQTQKQLAGDVLQSVGQSLWVEEENMLDAVTALSGSGPAYFFLMIESMTKAGVALGLSEQTAQQLSIKTALGAGMMADAGKESPRELRAKVTSPNGTTQAAIESFQDQDFEVIVAHAMRAAYDRAGELAVELGECD